MSSNAIEINDLYKAYDKKEQALRGLSMTVPTGSIYGLIGQNGSGKSTTVKTLMGLIQANAGSVNTLGENAWGISVETKRRIAYVPEVSFHFSWMSIREMMNYVAQFYPRWNQTKGDELLESLDLKPNKKVKSLSLGQTRAVSIIIALCCNPDLLILDEPAGNLDVVARRLFQQHILEFAQQEGKTVLMSSHVLTDLERVVDRVGIIRQGQMIVEEDLDTLKERLTHLRVVYENSPPDSFDIPNIVYLERFRNEARLTVCDFNEQQVSSYASIRNAKIETQPMSLEEIFVAYATNQPVGNKPL